MTRRSRRERRSRRGGIRRFAIAIAGFGLAYLLLSKRREGDDVAAPPPEQTRRLQGPEGVLRILDGGQGALPVLLLHGLGGSARQWGRVMDRLRRRRRCIALDFRGHGASSVALGGAYGLGDLASDVLEVAETLALDRFVLAGHSLGAAVAIEVADRSEGRVVGLCLLDPNGDQTRIPAQELASLRKAMREDAHEELAWHYRQILAGSDPATREQVMADLGRAAPEALRITLESSLEFSPLDALKRFSGPVAHAVSPLNDLPYSLHRLLPELQVRHFQGSHWLMMDRPAEISDLMESLVRECEPD